MRYLIVFDNEAALGKFLREKQSDGYKVLFEQNRAFTETTEYICKVITNSVECDQVAGYVVDQVLYQYQLGSFIGTDIVNRLSALQRTSKH
jgi:hypothetical protein